MASIKILLDDPPEAVRWTLREACLPPLLLLRLTTGSGEIVPAVILNLSTSGLLALVDERFSPLLPPPPGTRFEGEFFSMNLRSVGWSLKSCGLRNGTTRSSLWGVALFISPLK